MGGEAAAVADLNVIPDVINAIADLENRKITSSYYTELMISDAISNGVISPNENGVFSVNADNVYLNGAASRISVDFDDMETGTFYFVPAPNFEGIFDDADDSAAKLLGDTIVPDGYSLYKTSGGQSGLTITKLTM